MSRKTRIVVIVLFLIAFLGYRYYSAHKKDAPAGKAAVAAHDAAPRMLGSLAFKPCTLASQFGAGSIEAQCGALSVAENPALPAGRKIALNIAWIPADDKGEHAPDPVFLLAGGPGQAATESYPAVAPAFAEALKKRDVILVDQRGTGGSHPLACKSDGEQDESADDAASLRIAREEAEKCRDRLAKDADLRFYTTTDAVRDLDAVRKAIGAAQINLIGISYGTRVAQQYAMRYPAHTRTITLDSVAPNAIYLGNDFARNLENALALQFGRCAKIPSCAKALGDPRQRLDALMAKLKAEPPTVTYRDANTGEQKQERLLPAHVAGLARMYAYAPAAAALLPLQINEASQGRYEGLMALSKLLTSGLAEQMAYGMQLSVICTEDVDGVRGDPSMSTSLLGNALVDILIAQCAVWPKGARPADFHQPLTTPVPALLISGELDPVTPPSYADSVVKTLRKGRALTLRGQGHNVIGAGCMPKLFAQFLETADAKALDAKCLDKLAYTPPFTDFNGWDP
ncbi:alpha/beta hydrolase [Luteimonas sp. SX5]|uniref:Alpha/beta hydrolase n=1 Tax=Luteimonas galliterrae TaxID=2940486 RepID=A0ABT0MM69_9GAMM|nr:alpha/beta hydrolase [Luteimonas galliterrae]MCL1635981.1 alpha/beta hydrolase [Luteimonas galliterrae]